MAASVAIVILVAACSPASAQKAAAGVAQRIDAAFEIVPDNRVELAVPLTRRALARRAIEEDNLPLPFLGAPARAAAVAAIGRAVTPRRVATVPIFEPQSPPAAARALPSEGDADEEADLPRVPHPRPPEHRPPDLVAAAAPPPSRAASEPQRSIGASFGVDTSEPMIPVAPEAAPEPVKPVQVGLPQAPEPQQPLQSPLTPAAPTKLVAQASPPAVADSGPMTLAALQPTTLTRAAVLPLPETPRNVQPSAAPAAARPLMQPPPAAAEPQPSIEAPRRPEPVQTATAPGACLAPSQITDADGDFRRNAAALTGEGLCITEQKFKERRRPWDIQTVSSGRPGPLWVVVHDDEDLSFDTAVQALKTYGGTLVAIETGGKRNQDGIDPNRNFSDAGLSCEKVGKSASPKFTAAWRGKLDGFRPIIALHNNFDGPVPTTGIGHVAMDTAPRSWPKARAKDPTSPLAGKYDLVLLAGTNSSEPRLRSWMSELSGQGINVVLEPIDSDRGDCSLSNYAVLTGHPDYFNVTVDHGEGEKQRKIIDAIITGFSTVSAAR